jgi:hypothetical protein
MTLVLKWLAVEHVNRDCLSVRPYNFVTDFTKRFPNSQISMCRYKLVAQLKVREKGGVGVNANRVTRHCKERKTIISKQTITLL